MPSFSTEVMMSTSIHKHTCWQCGLNFLGRLILKTGEIKRQEGGGGGGRGICSKETNCESSNHLSCLLPLILCGWIIGVRLPCICCHDCCALACGHTFKRKEGWLYQVVFVLFCIWKLPITYHEVAQGLEFILRHILPLWVQQWEIDSTIKKTPKVLDIQFYNSLDLHISTCLHF